MYFSAQIDNFWFIGISMHFIDTLNFFVSLPKTNLSIGNIFDHFSPVLMNLPTLQVFYEGVHTTLEKEEKNSFKSSLGTN